MKRSKFFELYWDGRASAKQKALLAEQSPAFRAAWAVFEVLGDRGGFDGWWEEIDAETQDDCFDEIVKKIAKTLV